MPREQAAIALDREPTITHVVQCLVNAAQQAAVLGDISDFSAEYAAVLFVEQVERRAAAGECERSGALRTVDMLIGGPHVR